MNVLNEVRVIPSKNNDLIWMLLERYQEKFMQRVIGFAWSTSLRHR